jgi:hypothetical protein
MLTDEAAMDVRTLIIKLSRGNESVPEILKRVKYIRKRVPKDKISTGPLNSVLEDSTHNGELEG